MRNCSFFLGVLLLVEGVEKYNVTMSVMKGDSVTLKTGDTKIPEDDTIQWRFDDGIIARMNNAQNITSTSEGDDAGFKDRLKLDQTGSLTITNIRNTDSGLYKLLIKSTTETTKIFKVNVRDYREPESVMEGDPVTLFAYLTTIQSDDQIKWKFEDKVIAVAHILNVSVDERWKNIELNKQTGDLTIRNSQSDQSGLYIVEINTSSMILQRKIHLNISDVVESVSVMVGDLVPLYAGVTKIQKNDQIHLKFEDQVIPIARLNSAGGESWRNIHLNYETGDLTIENIRRDQSGEYEVEIKNQDSSMISHKKIRINIGKVWTTLEKTLIGILVVLGLVAGFVIYWKKCRSQNHTTAW